MIHRQLVSGVLALALVAAFSAPGWAQGKPKKATPVELDAAGEGEGPDPLAPTEKPKGPLAAPGAPTQAVEQKPAVEAHPIVVLVRQRLAEPFKGTPLDREDYAALAAFYADGDGQPVWIGSSGFSQKAQLIIAELRKAEDWGLRSSDFDVPALDATPTVEALANAEIKVGVAALKYARYARGGRLDPRNVSRIFDQTPSLYDSKSLIQAITASDAPDVYLRELHPKHPQFEKLRQALLAARGSKAVADPTQVRIPAGPQVKPGEQHPHVALIRQRLGLAASADGKDELLDETLAAALKTYQQQRGIKPTGGINNGTRDALNASLRPTGSESVQRLLVNMERWRWMPDDLGAVYVWNSVPEQMTRVYAKGKMVLNERIVVGKPGTSTPIFSADMQFIIFHPSWGVPPGMKQNELLPLLRNAGGGFFGFGGASSVLESHGLRVTRGGQPVNASMVNWSSVDINQYEFVQAPGPNNVLGIVKFRFPNKHNVYMHDTPERNLFGGQIRAFSHGCMRVQNPVHLAEVLLSHDKGWSADTVQGYVKRGGEIKLSTQIPVHTTYFTVTVSDDGKVQHWPDVYGLDPRVASALDGPGAAALVTSSIKTADMAEPTSGTTPTKSRNKKKQEPTLLEMLFGN